MSAKEVKAALKAAKTAIQAKDYAKALEHCNVIFGKDAENYNALVFAGLSYSETGKNEDARESYRKAIKSQPDQILAYQGLANLYTKHWKILKTKDDLEELITVYEKLITIVDRKDAVKRIELVVSFCDALIENGDLVKALETLSTEVEEFAHQKKEIKYSLYNSVFKVLAKVKVPSKIGKYFAVVDESFLCLINSEVESSTTTYLRDYLTFLCGNLELLHERIPTILDACGELAQKTEETLPLEVITQAFIQNYEHPSLSGINESLKKLDEFGSELAAFGHGYIDFGSAKYEEAYSKLNSSAALSQAFLPACILLCKSALHLHKYSSAKAAAKMGLVEYKLISSGVKSLWLLPIMSLEAVKFELSKCLAKAFCGSHVKEEVAIGIGTFEKLLLLQPEDIELHIGIAVGYIKQKNYSRASDFLNKVLEGNPERKDAIAWKAFVECKTGTLENGIASLQSIAPPTALSLFLLGKCMWDAGGELRKDKKNCFAALVKAAKLDPNLGEIFSLLGHFYSIVQRDNARAKQCYQKSYQLDPGNEETAACLADTYVAEGDTISAIELYQSITKELGSAGGKWAWVRLGLYQLKAKDIKNAIQCFQSALRIDSEDSVCWECLGEGYLQRGSFTAAWKAFDRAHQLNPNSVYSLYQMAKVKQVQGLYREAISEYSDILMNLFPGYVPALKGLGESELLLARHMFQEGRFGTGLERLQNAINNFANVCYLCEKVCCSWKLLGDCCMMVHSLHESVVSVEVPFIRISKEESQSEVGGLRKIGKSELLSLGVRFYCRALRLQPENSTLWHDLGVAYFRQAENRESEQSEYSTKAMNIVKKAITLEPTNATYWCTLGVIAGSKYIQEPALAQHCFLMSIKNEKNNVEAWNNLATLYLSHDQVKMAHEAFKVAQSLDPSFTSSWVGQAVIAETVGSNETMDLYRHSTELGLHKQGAAGYASWVVKVMADMGNHNSAIFKDNIRDMNAIPTAVTQMSKMSWKNPMCSWTSTIHGFLLEQSGLNQSAQKAYQRAHDSIALTKGASDNEVDIEVRRKICAINLARMSCKNGSMEAAVKLYDGISKKMDVRDACSLALACYKSGQFEKAFESYKMAGQLAVSESEKAEIMVAMAMVYWKMGKPGEAKTLLYQCFQGSKPGLRTLLSLGIAQMDKVLVGAAMDEMVKKLDSCDMSEIYDDCVLVAAASHLLGDPKRALGVVQKAIHRYPSSWSLRVFLSRLLVDMKGFHTVPSAPSITNAAERLFKLSNLHPLHRDSKLWKSQSRHDEHVTVEKSCALSTMAFGMRHKKTDLCEQAKERLRRVQKYAHMHPYESSSWSLLSCACHGRNVTNWLTGTRSNRSNKVLTSSLASHASRVEESMEIHNPSHEWLQEIKVWDSVIHSTESNDCDTRNSDRKFVSLLGMVSRTRDKSKLQPLLQRLTATMGHTSKPERSSRYFAELLIHLKMQQVARKMFDKSITLISGNEVEKLSTIMRLFQLLYNVTVRDDAKRIKLEDDDLKKTAAAFATIDSKSLKSLLFQGLAARCDKNHRKAKSFFNRVLNSTDTIDDETRSIAVWYLYRTLHERNDGSEIEKLVGKARGLGDPHVEKIAELLPVS